MIAKSTEYILGLARLSELQVLDEIPVSGEFKDYPSESILSTGSIVYLRTDDHSSTEDMKVNLEKDLQETNSQIKRLQNLLVSEFSKKAPEGVVSKEREKLKTYEETARKIRKQLDSVK